MRVRQQRDSLQGDDKARVFVHSTGADSPRPVSLERNDKGFWKAHDKLFASQSTLEDADLERLANELSLDAKKVLAAIQKHKHKAAIDADMALAEDFAVQGTPHFFINGQRYAGGMSVADMSAIIDAAAN